LRLLPVDNKKFVKSKLFLELQDPYLSEKAAEAYIIDYETMCSIYKRLRRWSMQAEIV